MENQDEAILEKYSDMKMMSVAFKKTALELLNPVTQKSETQIVVAKWEKKREWIISEICNTENTYMDNMRILLENYIVPMEEEHHLMLEDAQFAVFCNNLKQLIRLNTRLCDDLSHHARFIRMKVLVQDRTESVGEIFARYAPLFKLYANYAKDFNDVCQLLQDERNDVSMQFQAFVAKCKNKTACPHTLKSLLIMPVQRVPRYRSLLEKLLECTPQNFADAHYLQLAVEKVNEAAIYVNETIRQHENMASLLQVQSTFIGNISLVKSSRRLIQQGRLVKVSRKRPEKVMLHLFNDLLLYSDILNTGGYRLRRTIQLSAKSTKMAPHIPSNYATLYLDEFALSPDCGFTITSAEKSFMLFARTPSSQLEWTAIISEAINNAQSNQMGENTSMHESHHHAAAMWVPDIVAESCSGCKSNFTLIFRRHHCRHCGKVVCKYCSSKRAIVFGGNFEAKEERVCNRCYHILDIVKRAARKWLSLLIKQHGWLRRRRWHKWPKYYFEIHQGMLRQYSVAASERSRSTKPYDIIKLVGAKIIHRPDKSPKYPHCFQLYSAEAISRGAGKRPSLPPAEGCSGADDWNVPMLEERPSITPQDAGWILCATTASQEAAWITALQNASNNTLRRCRRSQSLGLPATSEPSPSPILEIVDAKMLRKPVKKLTGDAAVESQRHLILRELVRSEKSYVDCLGECISVFVQPLLLQQQASQQFARQLQRQKSFNTLQRIRSNKTLLAGPSPANFVPGRKASGLPDGAATILNQSLLLDADMAIFFSSVDQIYTLNRQLLEHLAHHLEETERGSAYAAPVHHMGNIFNSYAPLFNLYTAYASRHEAALLTINSEQFRALLSRLSDGATVKRLRTYLNMPMDRIPRYEFFLQDLLEKTPKDHEDYAPLQSSIEKVNSVVDEINENIMKREKVEKLVQLEKAFGISLRGRKLIHEGKLRKVCRRREKVYYFVLLNSALMYGRENGSSCKLHRLIDLNDCKVDILDDPLYMSKPKDKESKRSPNSFYFLSKAKSFVLVAESKAERQRWVHKLQMCINATKELLGPSPDLAAVVNHVETIDYSKLSNFILKEGILQMKTNSDSLHEKYLRVTQSTVSIYESSDDIDAEMNLPIDMCKILARNDHSIHFQLFCIPEHTATLDSNERKKSEKVYTFYASNVAECKQWIQVLYHCLEGTVAEYIQDVSQQNLDDIQLAPIFVHNKAFSSCMICSISFTVYRRRHHCRNCGNLICGSCSKNKKDLRSNNRPSRICDNCASTRQEILSCI